MSKNQIPCSQDCEKAWKELIKKYEKLQKYVEKLERKIAESSKNK
jgi:hypothetical protein